MATRKEHSTRPGRESLSKRLGKIARAIKARDGHRCVYLVLACRSCNSARHDMPLAAWCRQQGLDPRRVRRQAARALEVM